MGTFKKWYPYLPPCSSQNTASSSDSTSTRICSLNRQRFAYKRLEAHSTWRQWSQYTRCIRFSTCKNTAASASSGRIWCKKLEASPGPEIRRAAKLSLAGTRANGLINAWNMKLSRQLRTSFRTRANVVTIRLASGHKIRAVRTSSAGLRTPTTTKRVQMKGMGNILRMHMAFVVNGKSIINNYTEFTLVKS